MKKKYKLTIEPLTGVHIGTGEELTFLDYKIARDKKGDKHYIKFSFDKVVDKLMSTNKDLSEFYKITDSDNPKQLQEFIHSYITTDILKDVLEYRCEFTREFEKNYDLNIKKDIINNSGNVHQMYRIKGEQSPVIPGSALKGAIRTAILSYFLKNNKNKGGDNNLLQKKILQFDDAKNDPFRCIHLEDIRFEPEGTQLVGRLKNIKLQNNTLKHSSMNIQAEIIRGSLLQGEPIAEINLVIDEDLFSSNIEAKNFEFKKHISIQDIQKACNEFYYTEFNNEYDKFYNDTINSGRFKTNIIEELKKEFKDISEFQNTFIFRVGRWSQVEFMTFEDAFRDIKVPIRRGKPQSYGKTRTVFDYNGEYVPMGWCKCTYKEV